MIRAEAGAPATSRRWFCLSSSLVGLRGLEPPDPLLAKQALSQLSYGPTMESDRSQNTVGAPLACLGTQALALLALRGLVPLQESEQLAGDGLGLFGQHRVAGVRQIDHFDPVRSELLTQRVAVLRSGHRVIEPLDDEHRR